MKKERIIVVEDELLISQNIKFALEQDGYEVISNITTYEEAIYSINEYKPSLALIDISLKGNKDGIELGKMLLDEDKIPFIYISSHTDRITLEKVKNTRPYGFIVKPFDDVDVKTIVSLAIDNYVHKKIDHLKTNKIVLDDVPYRIKTVINYINKHLTEKIDLSELANLTKWKKHHFIRAFNKTLGLTPYQYILKKKIDMIKAEICETNVPINQIAYEYGFLNYSNFSTIFKKYVGLTPENYRKTIKSKNHYNALNINNLKLNT